MKEYKLSEALGNMPDDLLLEATKIKRKNTAARRFLRVAAIAAAVVILFWAVSLLPFGEDRLSPYFAMYVYANEANSVELLEGYIISMGKGPYVSEDNNGLGSDHPYFDSTISPVEDQNAFFRFDIIPDERVRAVAVDRFAVFCNGEPVEFNLNWAKYPAVQHIIVNRLRATDPDVFSGYCVHGVLKEDAVLDIILYDEEGNILQVNTVLIQPVEGGYDILLENLYVAELD